MISEKQKTLTAAKPQGSPPITPEPAPSPRLWASAWARPLADAITLTRTRKYHASKGTFLPCWKRGHFHFALTYRLGVERIDGLLERLAIERGSYDKGFAVFRRYC